MTHPIRIPRNTREIPAYTDSDAWLHPRRTDRNPMTTLYRPIEITSVDSLDELAPGIVVHCGPLVALKDSTYGWSQNLHQETNIKPAMIWRALELLEQAGFTAHALAPIEAEEETMPASHIVGTLTESGAEFTERTGEVASWQRRYVTPWVEDACPGDWESFTFTGEEA